MRRLLPALLVLCGPGHAQEADVAGGAAQRYEFRVVGVYRPVDLHGRTVQAPREVYLQPLSASGPISALVGQTIDVHRQVAVPASVPFADKPKPKKRAEKPAKKKKKKKKAKRRRMSRAARKKAAAEKAAKEKAEAEKAAAEKAAAEKAAEEQAKKKAAAPPPPDKIARVAPPTVKTTTITVPVGKVRVVEIRGDVVVALVVQDGVDGLGGPMAPAGAVPAVMAGDLARHEVQPPPPEPPPPLSDAEAAKLEEERKATEREDRRRRNPLKRYERRKMRWKL